MHLLSPPTGAIVNMEDSRVQEPVSGFGGQLSFSDYRDYRAREQASLHAGLTRRLDLKISLNAAHANRPPRFIEKPIPPVAPASNTGAEGILNSGTFIE